MRPFCAAPVLRASLQHRDTAKEHQHPRFVVKFQKLNSEGTTMALHPVVEQVTNRIIERSGPSRAAYLAHLEAARIQGVQRGALSCTNLAHGFAAFPANDKLKLREVKKPSVAIVSSYNDMLSAHQPFESYPEDHQGRRARDRRRGPVRRRRARHVRRRHAGPAGHGTVAVLARHHRHGHRRRRCRTICSTPACTWASATRSCRAC